MRQIWAYEESVLQLRTLEDAEYVDELWVDFTGHERAMKVLNELQKQQLPSPVEPEIEPANEE